MRVGGRFAGGWALGVAALLSGCAPAGQPIAATPADAVVLCDLQGASHKPLQVPPAGATALLFITTDCPIANAYAPRIGELRARYRGRPVRFYLVHVDPQVTRAQALQHRAEYALDGPILLDPEHRLVRAAGITITPEAALFDSAGRCVYRGRIDNWFGDLGRKRPAATRHDLQDALDAVLAGTPVATPRTQAVGCSLPDPRPTRR